MDFTVTIVTRNRADSLKESLRSLTAQSYPPDLYEVIVADNGSTDRTRDVAEGMAGDFRHFRYLYDPKPGQLVGWHLVIGAKSYHLRHFSYLVHCNADKWGIWTDLINPDLLHVLPGQMMRIALTGRVLRPIPRFS